jgi:hypothetical protein
MEITTAWHRYLDLVHPGGVCPLRKAQNVLAVDFHAKLLDRVFDGEFLRERII